MPPMLMNLMNLTVTGSIRSILQAFSGCDLCRGVIKPLGGPDQSSRCLFLAHFVGKGCPTWKKRSPKDHRPIWVLNFGHNYFNMLIIHVFFAQSLRTFYIHESVQNWCISELKIYPISLVSVLYFDIFLLWISILKCRVWKASTWFKKHQNILMWHVFFRRQVSAGCAGQLSQFLWDSNLLSRPEGPAEAEPLQKHGKIILIQYSC